MSETQPLPGNFGIEVIDADIATISDKELRQLLLDLYSNRIAVLRAGCLSEAQYVDFARRVGDPLLLIPNKTEYPEIIPLDNLREDIRETKRSAAHWHTDQSFTIRWFDGIPSPNVKPFTGFQEAARVFAGCRTLLLSGYWNRSAIMR